MRAIRVSFLRDRFGVAYHGLRGDGRVGLVGGFAVVWHFSVVVRMLGLACMILRGVRMGGLGVSMNGRVFRSVGYLSVM